MAFRKRRRGRWSPRRKTFKRRGRVGRTRPVRAQRIGYRW